MMRIEKAQYSPVRSFPEDRDMQEGTLSREVRIAYTE